MLITAEAGPIGAPVEKQAMANMQPIRLKKLAKKPSTKRLNWKDPSFCAKLIAPKIWKTSDITPQ